MPILLTGVILWMLVYCLSLPRPAPDLALFVLLPGALWAEWLSVPLGRSVRLSAGYSIYLAATLTVGLSWTALLMLLALAFRSLLAGNAPRAWRETVLDAFPILASLCVLHALTTQPLYFWRGAPLPLGVRVLIAAEIYLPLVKLLPISFERGARSGSLLLRVASAGLGVVLALLMQVSPLSALWAFPLLVLFQRSARLEAPEMETVAQQRIGRVEHRLAEVRQELWSTRSDLLERSDAFALLESLSRTLPGSVSVHRALELIANTVWRLVACRSVVLFLSEDGHPVPAFYQSASDEQLRSWRLIQPHESAIEEAWRERRTVLVQKRHAQASQLFSAELSGAVVPIGDTGLLYVGREDPQPLSERQLHLLGILAHQAEAALQAVNRQEAVEKALQAESQLSSRMQRWLALLEEVLQASQALSSTLEPAQMLAGLEQWLTRMVPHSWRLVQTREGSRGLGSEPDAGTKEQLLSLLATRQAPLLIEDLTGSAFSALAPGLQSLLAFPLLGESGFEGAVLLAGVDKEGFTRDQQHLVGILGFQVGIGLNNCRLHATTVDALRRLQESETQLIESSKMAAVGQLAAGMAHELNTPLATILMAVESAMVTADPESRVDLERAAREALRAQTIIEKVLYYSRDALAGDQEVELGQVCRDVLEIVGAELRKAGVLVDLRLEPELRLIGNANELQQVLLNLLLNARDAVHGLPEPRILINGQKDRGLVVLEVSDNGVGVPEGVRNRIFEPFFTTKPIGEGTGLGLSISQQIAVRHGGSLEHLAGSRTTFQMCLPLSAPS